MSSFMDKEIVELGDHFGGSPARKPTLGEIDADRAMLAGMVDLHHPVAKGLARVETRRNGHATFLTRAAIFANGSNPLGIRIRHPL